MYHKNFLTRSSSGCSGCKTETWLHCDQRTKQQNFLLGILGKRLGLLPCLNGWARHVGKVPTLHYFSPTEICCKDRLICVQKSHSTLTSSPKPIVSALKKVRYTKTPRSDHWYRQIWKRISAKARPLKVLALSRSNLN